MLEHTLHECKKDDCFICSGGLSSCEVCGGGEGSLSMHCYGAKLESYVLEAIYNKWIDYIGGYFWYYSKEDHKIFHADRSPITLEGLENLYGYQASKEQSKERQTGRRQGRKA